MSPRARPQPPVERDAQADVLSVAPDFGPSDSRASDADRERTVAILRAHWVAGRLTVDEFEARCSEAWQACFVGDLWGAMRELPVRAPVRQAPAPVRQVAPTGTPGVLALTLGITGAALLVVSLGLLFVLSLQLSVSAWVCGRQARHKAVLVGAPRGMAVAGETLGIVGTILGFLAFAGCAAFISAF